MQVCTVDRYQGRDKEVILISLVRNNAARRVGDLLSDWRRVNVAITRARSKLIIVGSASTLEGDELLGKMVKFVTEEGRLVCPTEMALVEGTPEWCMRDAWATYRKMRASGGKSAKAADS